MTRLTKVMLGALCAAAVKVAAEDAGGWSEKRNEKGKVVQEMKIQAPSFTEEDQYGYVMPERYKCDACRAVMYHLNDGLTKRHPKSRKMKQWEYTDVFDEVCRDHFQGYGVKLVNDENTLSGPGIRQEEDLAPGSGAIQMGGESWTKRLGEICRKVVYERIGEDELYDMFYAKRFAESKGMETVPEGITERLCSTDLRDCIVGPKKPKADVPEVTARPSPRPRPRKEKKRARKPKLRETSQKCRRRGSMPTIKNGSPSRKKSRRRIAIGVQQRKLQLFLLPPLTAWTSSLFLGPWRLSTASLTTSTSPHAQNTSGKS